MITVQNQSSYKYHPIQVKICCLDISLKEKKKEKKNKINKH